MNRTPLLPKTSSLSIPTEPAEFAALEVPSQRGLLSESTQPVSAAAHCLLSPEHYESGYAYPLIVWIHSAHSNEEELWQVMPLISTRNYVAVAPRATQVSREVPAGFEWGQSVDQLAAASQRALQCVAIAQEQYQIHPERIFIAGYAAGGTMAQRIGLENPDKFAGAISLSGPVPRGARPLRNINQARQLPLLLSVSPAAENYSEQRVMEDLRFFHSAGLSLSLRLYPAGDGLTDVMLRDVNRWVMESFLCCEQ